MYYRRKIILSLLEVFGNSLSKLEIQKYLFLLSRTQKKPVYDFLPYKYGCYSFSLKSDLDVMQKKGFLNISEKIIKRVAEESFLEALEPEDLRGIKKLHAESAGYRDEEELIHYVYTLAPFYAINSLVKEKYLDAKELENVEESKPVKREKALCTIGYEGISIEAYINRLIKNDIRCLVDVRKNPHSMKFGFSGKRLQHICEEVGIKYISVRELGIDSDKRKKLETQKDYDELFKVYLKTNLKNTGESQEYVLELFKKHKRIALTCFEKDIGKCHRKVLADYLVTHYSPVKKIKHI